MVYTISDQGDRINEVSHASAHVRCPLHQRPALVSVIDRTDAPIRFVLWCSLRASEGCSEKCLRAPLEASVTSSPGDAAQLAQEHEYRGERRVLEPALRGMR